MVVPKLRFPEFSKEGSWKEESISNLLDYERPDAYIVSDTNYQKVGTPVLTANKSFILGYTNEEHGIYKNAPAIIFDDFTVDKKFVDFPFKVKSSAIKILKEKGDNNIRFIFELLCQIRFEAKEHKRYYISAYQNLLVNIPKPKEQQKIASCLSSLDDLITAHTQKLDTMKAHKKGLMQQLFPAEGEKVPKLRFEEFKDSGEWEEDLMDNVAEFLKGKGISKADISLTGSIPCIRYGELYTHYQEVIDTVISFTDLSPDELILSEANDVIIPSSGETREDIATASCVLKRGIALGGDLNIIRTQINGIFLSYYLTHAKKKAIAKLAQGDAVVHLYSSQLKKLPINFPKSKGEQEKIADCLSSLDRLIKVQAKKIEQMKLHKKGLMQGLFPNFNEEKE